MDWNYENFGDGEDIDGSFNLFGISGSTSDVGNNSSTKSSLSCEPSVCSGEPFIGLKLGKRTYFENNYAKNYNKTSHFLGGVSTKKKVKPTCEIRPISRCQVEGCGLDLSSAKEYHRKHRVCEMHSKCPKVIVAGVERRFCQQCSRFHGMSEFDEEKRSCRKRLSDHNARRRKPQNELIRFNPTSIYSSFYGAESIDPLPDSVGLHMSDVLNMSSKEVRPEIFDQGLKEPLSSNVDAVNLRRALSLLSNHSWDPNSIPMHSTNPIILQHQMPQGSPFSSQEYCQATHPSFDHASAAKNANSQIFKSSYENSLLFHPNG